MRAPSSLRPAAVWLLLGLALPAWSEIAQVHTNPLNNEPIVKEGYRHFYDLDFPAATAKFDQFHAQHPGDPQATVLLLEVLVFEELYRQDLLDTTFYANDGFLSGRHATQEDTGVRDRLFGLADETVHEADWRLSKNANDADALYARGWARALRCTYMAMVERSYGAAFKLAVKAKDDEAKVLQLDPNYVDAKLVVGIYEYVVGALPLPFKILIGFMGMTGSKARGLEMLTDDGNRGLTTSVEARTAIALFLRRESRYKEAIGVVRSLKAEYPHDYLFSLEEANLSKDAGEGMGAVAAYKQILDAGLNSAYYFSPRMELTYFGLGDAQRGQRHYTEAAAAYEKAATTLNVSPELKIRTFLAAGECHDLNAERDQAIKDYQSAVDAGPNTSRADTARKYLHAAYKGN